LDGATLHVAPAKSRGRATIGAADLRLNRALG